MQSGLVFFSKMKIFAILVIAVVTVSSAKRLGPLPQNILTNPNFKGQPEEKIVGGTVVDPKYSIPWQISFEDFGSHICGGAIINENFILTAGHCCYGGDADYVSIVAGEHDLGRDEGPEQRIDVAEIISHENFDYDIIANDVCLLRLKEPLVFNDEVQPVKLPEQDQAFESGDAIVSGWGTLHAGDFNLPDLLHVVTVPLVIDDDCAKAYGNDLIPDMMICAGESGKDSCQGDSGGPMTCEGLHCGVVSWGIGCGSPGYPGVYAETSKYVDWINSKISKY